LYLKSQTLGSLSQAINIDKKHCYTPGLCTIFRGKMSGDRCLGMRPNKASLEIVKKVTKSLTVAARGPKFEYGDYASVSATCADVSGKEPVNGQPRDNPA
jgi:hypothetical protein